jgi:hypothetical protein
LVPSTVIPLPGMLSGNCWNTAIHHNNRSDQTRKPGSSPAFSYPIINHETIVV